MMRACSTSIAHCHESDVAPRRGIAWTAMLIFNTANMHLKSKKGHSSPQQVHPRSQLNDAYNSDIIKGCDGGLGRSVTVRPSPWPCRSTPVLGQTFMEDSLSWHTDSLITRSIELDNGMFVAVHILESYWPHRSWRRIATSKPVSGRGRCTHGRRQPLHGRDPVLTEVTYVRYKIFPQPS